MTDLDERVAAAVRHFWDTRTHAGTRIRQDLPVGRASALGGKQLDAFALLIRDQLVDAGIAASDIYIAQKREIPGYFRATKQWDVLVVVSGHLLAAIELKSQVGSFGNNLNNRVEESVGSAQDFWTAVRESAFGGVIRPWLGYFFLLEEKHGKKGSMSPVATKEPHFPVLQDFDGASHALRLEIACRRLVQERLYDAAWFLLSSSDGAHREPDLTMGASPFMGALTANVTTKFETLRQSGLVSPDL